MHFVDHVFILLLFVAQPINGAIEMRRFHARIAAGLPAGRIRFYLETSIVEWVFLIALGTAWWILGRPIADLGWKSMQGVALWGGAVVLVVMVGSLVLAWQSTRRATQKEKAKQVVNLGTLVHLLPHTRRELRHFFGISITAGIVEEIVYRGFVLWYLGLFMPIWVAVVISSIGFFLAHTYQGVSWAARAGLVGLGFAIFYVLTGSIWFPILAHIALDVLQGLIGFELLQTRDETIEEPASA